MKHLSVANTNNVQSHYHIIVGHANVIYFE